jgi:hypothetical protein
MSVCTHAIPGAPRMGSISRCFLLGCPLQQSGAEDMARHADRRPAAQKGAGPMAGAALGARLF